MKEGWSLRGAGLLLMFLAFASGAVAASLWLISDRAWTAHMSRAELTGVGIYETLRLGEPSPQGVDISPLSEADAALADRGLFARLEVAPRPAYVTNVSLIEDAVEPMSGDVLSVAILSDRLTYPLRELANAPSVTRQLGALTELMASYCSASVMVVRRAEGPWLLVDGRGVWGCEAAPNDLRLASVIVAGVALLILATKMADLAQPFERFAHALRRRARIGGPEAYEAQGPAELRGIVAAVNATLEDERDRLEKRAVVLSGVSHDLGTPATRLRLRAALIPEPELRAKFEADIDQMTGMIESVLTYTRAELASETPRDLSLTSLIEAIVADYQDMGASVSLAPMDTTEALSAGSLFTANRGYGGLGEVARVVVMARPISLTRAVTNLIDNALKYGRAAHVSLRADAHQAVIEIEDEGGRSSPEDIAALMAPFKRGENTAGIDGVGLGLTIVATVAESHGGTLDFHAGSRGLMARLTIPRQL